MLLREWVDDGWLEMVDASNRNRAYGLSAMHRQEQGIAQINLHAN